MHAKIPNLYTLQIKPEVTVYNTYILNEKMLRCTICVYKQVNTTENVGTTSSTTSSGSGTHPPTITIIISNPPPEHTKLNKTTSLDFSKWSFNTS